MLWKSVGRKLIPCYCFIFALSLWIVHFGSRTVTTIVETTPLDSRTCIAIDAGHGGIDGGAVSISGVEESQINLQISKRLNDLLHLLGYKTFMLRDTDTSLHTDGSTISAQKISDLKHRIQMISDQQASLLISIHQNTFSDKRYSGAQVFYHDDERSNMLANQLQYQLIHTLNPTSKRKSKPAKGIYLMEHLPCPGILLECGFLTNAQEDAKLQSDAYQKEICSVIAATVSCNWK